MQYINNFSWKRDKVSIDITSTNFFCLVFLSVLQGSILCSLFLTYIKSNQIVYTVIQLAADDILFFITMLKL